MKPNQNSIPDFLKIVDDIEELAWQEINEAEETNELV